MMIRRWRGPLIVVALVVQVVLLTSAVARSAPLSPAAHPPTSLLPALPVVTGDATLDHAERVALAVLAANQSGDTHRAAPFYVTPWIRDSFAWGMIPNDSGTLATYAQGELRYWLARQRSFGGWISFQYSGWYDETPILIAAVLDAYRLTGDRSAVIRALPALRRAWSWLHGAYGSARQHGSSCLLWATLEPTGHHWATDWADQVARSGYTPQLEGLWYKATHAMAAMEWLAGRRTAAYNYDHVAACIARDAQRLLWTVETPAHRDVPALAPFGHFASRLSGGNYFEIDGNALLIASSVATRTERRSVLQTIAAHRSYLLGSDGAGPSRVVYGDYAPQDYGPIHNWMGANRYQSAYWPSVGGLLAIAAARTDNTTLALQTLQELAHRAADSGSAFYEWYDGSGRPSGAAQYGWGARLYLLALYRAYLGVDDSPGITDPADLVLRAAPGPAQGTLVRLGGHVTVIGHGRGPVRYAVIDHRLTVHSFVVPARLLHDGAIVEIYRG